MIPLGRILSRTMVWASWAIACGAAWAPATACAAQALGRWVDVPGLKNQPVTQVIQGLQWKNRELTFVPGGGRIPTAIAVLEGRYSRRHWSLMINRRNIRLLPDGRFRVSISVERASSTFKFIAVGPSGDIESQRFRVEFFDFANWSADQTAASQKKNVLYPSIGLSLLSYRETLSPDVDQVALTLKLSYLYAWKPPRWDIGLSAFGTALPLSSSLPETSARFVGINARIGYVLPQVSEPWRVSVMTGIYYATMFASNSTFGFSDLMGPQFFPVVRRSLGNDRALGFYGKFSPVGSGLAIQSLANREIAVGVNFMHRVGRKGALFWSIDFADLRLSIDGIDIDSRSLSFGVGLSSW